MFEYRISSLKKETRPDTRQNQQRTVGQEHWCENRSENAERVTALSTDSRLTYQQTDGPTDRQTDRPTDTVAYRSRVRDKNMRTKPTEIAK